MPTFPFDVTFKELQANLDEFVAVVVGSLESEFLVLPTGTGFIEYSVFESGYEALKRALKADIDEEAWATLHTTVSRPFAKPASGKICVKVINHFGDEVQKVFNV